MAPTLRKGTRQKSQASKDADVTRRKLKATTQHPRRRVYKLANGLVSMKPPKELEHITIANATNSPLLRLPPELRTRIFKYALGGTLVVPPSWFHPTYTTHRWENQALSLIRVCRQTYHETATMMYAENTFSFRAKQDFENWALQRSPAQLEAIYNFVLYPRTFVYYRLFHKAEAIVKRFCPKLKTFTVDHSDYDFEDTQASETGEDTDDSSFL